MSFNSVTGYLTGGLIDPATPDYAGAATKAERQRKGLINQGIADINAVFSGGTLPSYAPAEQFDTSQNYYRYNNMGGYTPYWSGARGPLWNIKGGGTSPLDAAFVGTTAGGPLGGALGGSVANFSRGNPMRAGLSAATAGGSDIIAGLLGGSPESPTSHLKKAYGKGQLYTRGADQTYAGFGPEFFNKAAQNYVDYAIPQLAKQYSDTLNSIKLGLANRRLLGSGAQQRALSDVNYTVGQQEQQIGDTARQTALDLQRSVENARNQALNQLYSSANPSQALQSSIASAAGFQVPQTFGPLLNAFSGLANQYAQSQLYNPPGVGGINYINQFQYPGQSSMLGYLPPTALYGGTT